MRWASRGGADERAAWRIAGCAEGLFNIDSMHGAYAITVLNNEVAHPKSLQDTFCKLSTNKLHTSVMEDCGMCRDVVESDSFK